MDDPNDSIRLILVDGQLEQITDFRRELREVPGHVLQVRVCADADDALSAISEGLWDAVVIDWDRGKDPALDLLHAIGEQAEPPPAIIITQRYERADDLACMRAGAAGFLVKDCLTMESLERTLRYTIKHARTARRLEESLRVRDHFLSLLAHDVRGPLGVLASGLDLYARRFRTLPTEKVEKFLQQAEQQTRQIQALTTQVLDWASSQSPDFHPYRTTFLFAECLESALQTLKPLASGKSISIENKVAPETRLHADRNMWETILRNLLSNAIKFSQPRSHIDVEATARDGDYQISVRDQGIGIDEDLRHKLQTGHAVEARRGTGNEKGSGLGLLLCHRFTALHGGTLAIQANKGGGTCVTVTLPLASLTPSASA